jgi:hypothetical protein
LERVDHVISYSFFFYRRPFMGKRKREGDIEISRPNDADVPRARSTTAVRNASGRVGGSTSYHQPPSPSQHPNLANPEDVLSNDDFDQYQPQDNHGSSDPDTPPPESNHAQTAKNDLVSIPLCIIYTLA